METAPATHLVSSLLEAELVSWAEEARRSGIEERAFRVAGQGVLLRFAGPELVRPMTRALAHHPAVPGGEAALTVHLRAGPHSPTVAAAPSWVASTGLVRGRYQAEHGLLHVVDVERGLGVFHASGDGVPSWEEGAPLKLLFHEWMASRDRHLVHAAAVGYANGGVLLVGRGGSGKSTAALACLPSLLYAGDDYCLVAPTPEPFVFSLYSSAKLHLRDLARFPDLRAAADGREPSGKALLFLHESTPRSLSHGFPLRAVLVPRIQPKRPAALIPLSPSRALMALAPSTLFQLRAGEPSFESMAGLVRRLPCFQLDMGEDVGRIPPLLAGLLD